MIARRTFVKAAPMAAVGLATSTISMGIGHSQQVPNSAGSEAARLKAPPGACDCHHHSYDAARFPPVQQGGTFTPNARVEECRLLQKRIGTTRNVVVTSLPYDTDNRVTLDAIA
jgi:D-galactarolactone isomerase